MSQNVKDWLRACDICGHPWPKSKMRPIGFLMFACPDDYPGVHAKGTVIMAERNKRDLMKAIPKARRNIRPWHEVPVYEQDEARIFNLAQSAPYGVGLFGSPTPWPETISQTAERARYFQAIVTEGKRPTLWVTEAKAMVKAIADSYVPRQINLPSQSQEQYFGGVSDPVTQRFNSGDAANAGLVWCWAYQNTGNSKYILAAQRAAVFLRAQQCTWASTSNFTSSDAAGTLPYKSGMWVSAGKWAMVPSTISQQFLVSDVVGIEFLSVLKAIMGDIVVTPVAEDNPFTIDTSAPLSQMIAEATTAWRAAAGFSPTFPADYYQAGPCSPGGIGWQRSDVPFDPLGGDPASIFTTLNWARAMRSWFNVYGADDVVTTNWKWLRGLAANVAFVPPTTETAEQLAVTNLGTFDPTVAPPTQIDAVLGQNASAVYDLASAGAMAGIHAALNPDTFPALKSNASQPRSVYNDARHADAALEPNVYGTAGLSWQTLLACVAPSASLASMVGNLYRYGAQRFSVT